MNLTGAYTNKLLNIIKGILVFFTFGFVFYKLFYAYHIKSLYETFHFDTEASNLVFFYLVIVFAAINWLVESAKWRLLIRKYEPMSFGEAVKGVLSGIALGMITPNQIGNFVGRVIHLKELGKIKGSLVSVIGNTAQVVMTLAFGLMASIWFMKDQLMIGDTLATVLYFTLLCLIILSVVCFLNLHWVSVIAPKSKVHDYLQVFRGYSRPELTRVIIYSLIRYIIFVTQYFLLIRFYHVTTGVEQSIMCICGSLFIQAFVPSFILVDVGMRGASALLLFGYYTDQPTAILLMTYSVWMINLLVPGLSGLYFILKWRMNK